MNIDFARRRMVEQQVRTWDVDDSRVLGVLANLARDRFVPPMYADLAYADTEIPLIHGQCILRPLMDGRILQVLSLAADDKVLEIGTGSGYLTACLAHLCAAVSSIDIYPDLVTMAKNNLATAGISNVDLTCSDALVELPEATYDAIVVGGSVPSLPEHFAQALAPGGRLFVVVGASPVKTAVLNTRTKDGSLETVNLFETDIPALVNVEETPPFAF